MGLSWDDEDTQAFNAITNAFEGQKRQRLAEKQFQLAQNQDTREQELQQYKIKALETENSLANRQISSQARFNRFIDEQRSGRSGGQGGGVGEYISYTQTPTGGTIQVPSFGEVKKQQSELAKSQSGLLDESLGRVMKGNGSTKDFEIIHNSGLDLNRFLTTSEGITPEIRQETIKKRVEQEQALATRKLDDAERAALTFMPQIQSSIQMIKDTIRLDPKLLSGFTSIGVDMGQPLLARSPEAQKLQGELSFLKSTIPFSRGGKTLSKNESDRIERLINITGKSPKRIEQDLGKFLSEFSTNIDLILGGAKQVKEFKSKETPIDKLFEGL